jgi:hypothetical protein
MTKKFIFTISVHNSEYTEDFDEFEMPRSEEEEHFGELDDVESIIDFQYLNSKKELEEHINDLSKQYRVHRDKISYHQSIEPEDVVWDGDEPTVGTALLPLVLDEINDYSALELTDKEMKTLKKRVSDLREYDDVEREINKYLMEIGYTASNDCIWVKKDGNNN